MKRLLALVAAAAVLAACGADSPSSGAAANVNGATISNQSVVDELLAIAGNPDYLATIPEEITVTGGTPGSFDAAFAAQVLTVQIQYKIVSLEVRNRDLDVDEACRRASRTDVIRGFAPDASQSGEPIFEQFPEAYQDYLIERNADVLLLQGDLVGQGCIAEDGTAEAYYEDNKDDFEQTCASHILVATREEADAVVAQLQGGADFAALAPQLSTDTGSAVDGGALPCFTGGQYVPEFEEAALALDVGEVSGPVETQFGFHVIKVTSREVPPFDEVADAVQEQLGELVQGAFRTFFDDALASADITVDERYGEWDPARGEVIAPDASATPTTG